MSTSIQGILQSARRSLAAQLPPDEAGTEARLLLMHVLAVDRAWLIAHAAEAVPEQHIQAFEQLLQRRLAGEPVAYLLGHREFFGLKLKVTPDTLIPRPDTETLVEAALQKIHAAKSPVAMRILDLGTGTGAIALAIASQAPQTMVTAVDASAAALAVARDNALSLGLNNVRCLQSDWFTALEGEKFDLIVSNPPYIETEDPHLSQGDLRFEPLTALASGPDGLTDIRKIIPAARAHLDTRGWLMLEHAYNQAAAVQQLLNAHGFQSVETVKDLGNLPRVTLGQLV